MDKCVWKQDGYDGSWDTDCNNKFCIEEGTPEENEMLFCCYCGKEIGRPAPAPHEADCKGGGECDCDCW